MTAAALDTPIGRARPSLAGLAARWAWPLAMEEILARLVVVHDERVAEESGGTTGGGTTRWPRGEPAGTDPGWSAEGHGRMVPAVGFKGGERSVWTGPAAPATWPDERALW